jgi:hypothetical protein
MNDKTREKVKSIGGFLLLMAVWIALMTWVLPRLGYNT